jgi:hypothetical protein
MKLSLAREMCVGFAVPLVPADAGGTIHH